MMICSFSGGRTSAYMAWWLKHIYPEPVKFIFANTGCEMEETLEFINECDKRWGLDVIWVEAVVDPERGYGHSTKHRVVTFETASRDGLPFEDVIKKYGIPNMARPHCTRETKVRPMESFLKSEGLWNDRTTCVGIRIDEIDRMSSRMKEDRLVYPLISMNPTTEADVMQWWSKQDFDLGIKQYQGNCHWCWKKSFKKLALIASESPGAFAFPERMEALYSEAGAGDETRSFFRGNLKAVDILEMAKQGDKYIPPTSYGQTDMFWDAAGGCSESCEIYSD